MVKFRHKEQGVCPVEGCTDEGVTFCRYTTYDRVLKASKATLQDVLDATVHHGEFRCLCHGWKFHLDS